VRLPQLRSSRPSAPPDGERRVPDYTRPPANRGSWEEAALTNVEITEIVKRNIRTVTRPWNK
jgi:hypothetical protein